MSLYNPHPDRWVVSADLPPLRHQSPAHAWDVAFDDGIAFNARWVAHLARRNYRMERRLGRHPRDARRITIANLVAVGYTATPARRLQGVDW